MDMGLVLPEGEDPMQQADTPALVVFSGGTAFNSIAGKAGRVTFIIPAILKTLSCANALQQGMLGLEQGWASALVRDYHQETS